MQATRANLNTRRRQVLSLTAATAGLCLAWFAWRHWSPRPEQTPLLAIASTDSSSQPEPSMASIEGGQFVQGRDNGPADSRPARRVVLRHFMVDRHEVTNRRFQGFIEDTGYVTTAERLGYGWVFDFSRRKVRRAEGASWRRPTGPDSQIVGRGQHPVVQVSWRDAEMFASWDGKRLPTEAEYECAAAGGRQDADFPWGTEASSREAWRHNTWQGPFPHRPTADDGFQTLARVGSFEPNAFGLFDMTGNVREWCADWYRDDYYQIGSTENPTGPATGVERVVRGGSWMSTEAQRTATVWRRFQLPANWSDDRTGFRCVKGAERE